MSKNRGFSLHSDAKFTKKIFNPESLMVCTFIYGILELYHYKLKPCHKLLSDDKAGRETFVRCTLSKTAHDSQQLFYALWTDETLHTLHI